MSLVGLRSYTHRGFLAPSGRMLLYSGQVGCHVGHPYPFFFFSSKSKNHYLKITNRHRSTAKISTLQPTTTAIHQYQINPNPPKKKKSEKEQATTGLKSKQAGKRGRDRWCRHFSTVVLQFGSVASDRLCGFRPAQTVAEIGGVAEQ